MSEPRVLLILGLLSIVACTSNRAGVGRSPQRDLSNGPFMWASEAPTPEDLLDIARRITEGWINGDALTVERYLSDRFVDFKSGMRVDKAGLVKMVGDFRCAVGHWELSEPQRAEIDADTFVLSYRGVFDGWCSAAGGETIQLLSPARAVSVFVRSGNGWQGVFHSENSIAARPDARVAPGPSGATRSAGRAPNESGILAAQLGEYSSSPGAHIGARASASTWAVLERRHEFVWKAVVAGASAAVEPVLSSRAALVDVDGVWVSGKSAVLKRWLESVACSGRFDAGISDAVATSISPTVTMVTMKANVTGVCGDRHNETRFQTAIYARANGNWNLAFVFESRAD